MGLGPPFGHLIQRGRDEGGVGEIKLLESAQPCLLPRDDVVDKLFERAEGDVLLKAEALIGNGAEGGEDLLVGVDHVIPEKLNGGDVCHFRGV